MFCNDSERQAGQSNTARIKIMLYEPGTSGHRPIYLRYIIEAFEAKSIQTIVITEDFAKKPASLAALAARHGCRLIFVCTLDGLYPWLLQLGFFAKIRRIEIVGIYYLFNNLSEGWKAVFWGFLLRVRLLAHVFAPDLLMEGRPSESGTRQISFLPDPWDARVLREIDIDLARSHCNLSGFGGCVFLVFGEISRRKGIVALLDAMGKWDYSRRPDVRVLIAGRVTDEIDSYMASVLKSSPRLREVLVLVSRWIREEDHSVYFSAASYLCALYPRGFKVSISTVIRSFAVRRPVVVGAHGMIGGIVGSKHAGFVCNTGDEGEVLAALEKAYDCYMLRKSQFWEMALAGEEVANLSELKKFRSILASFIDDWGRVPS
ncbi:MAG TPA: glycosyltransferase [Lacunisphaera sp.]|nr:glycosyltransferase [Lacunisphaera sp.]